MNAGAQVAPPGSTSPGRAAVHPLVLGVVELRRLARQGGLRRPTLVVGVLAVAVGLAAVAILRWVSSGQVGGVVAALPIEGTSAFFALVAALVAASWAGRDSQRGMLAVSVVVVPRREVLVLAQVGAVAAHGALWVLLVTALVGLAVLVVAGGAGLGVVLGGLAVAVAAAPPMLVIGHAVGRLCGGAMVAVLTCVGWWVVLPMASALGAVLLPSALARAVGLLVDTSPVVLLGQATTVSSVPTLGVSDLLTGLGGLLVWAVVLTAAAVQRVRTQSF